jgi:hypothetical protein
MTKQTASRSYLPWERLYQALRRRNVPLPRDELERLCKEVMQRIELDNT